MPSPTGMSMEFSKPERRNSGSIRSFDSGSSLPEVFINAAFDYADSDTSSSCPSHEYEDLQSVRTAAKTGPRRKDNALYETTLPIPRRERQITECSDVSSAYTVGSDVSPPKKESCLSKLILFLILAFSVAALVLVLLIILGKMGPKCTCTQAESSKHPAVPRTGRAFSVQNLLKQIQDLKSNMKTMEARVHAAEIFVTKHEEQVGLLQAQVSAQKMIVNETANKVAAVDGVWLNMSNTHKAFELKLDTEFRLLNKSVKALNESDGDLTLKINELRRNQILTLGMSRKLAVNVTQLESRVQELKKSSNNVSSRVGSLERGYTQMSTLMKILQAVNGAQNSSHVYLQSLYNSVQDSLARVNATVNNKLKAPVSTNGKIAADFKLCQHKRIPGTQGSSGVSAFSSADYREPATKRVMGAACSTDYARHYKLLSRQKGLYECQCRGVSPVFNSDNPATINCFLHVWECPIG